MRTCQSCGAENPDDRDFCSCGEYLRWEPTGFVQAITPEMVKQATAPEPPAADAPPPAPPQVTQAPSPEPEDGNGNGHAAPSPSTAPVKAVAPPPPAAPVAKTLVYGAVPPPAVPEHEPATVVLRLPEGDAAKGETLHQQVAPGLRERVLALVRNQSGIVDNYDLRVEGLPADWWSIYPGTVYLVPFGSGGTYEQEVEVHLHPPKSPQAEAKVWELRVVAQSKAQGRDAASAPLALHVLPYVETATTLRPQRRTGRRRAEFDVTVTNKANAPVLVALEGEDPDGELQFGFNRPPQEIPPGAAVRSSMRVRPPKPMWIGRAVERRLEVKTLTGEEAAERAAAEPLSADVLTQPGGVRRRGLLRRRVPDVPGVYGPRVYKPQVYPPDATLGPGGLQLRMPKLQAPHLQGPKLKPVQLKPDQLKLPGRGGAAAPAGPLLPTQGIFRHKAWIPWWAVPLLIAIIALLLVLYKLSPQQVVVPQVIGQRSAFKAEQKLTEAGLKLDPNLQKQTAKAPAGSVLNQTPKAGIRLEKGATVSLLIAVATKTVDVPNIVGKTAIEADHALRARNLTLGQASPQPLDPEAKISSQIPAADEVVKQGTPVNIFYPDPKATPPPTRGAGKTKATPTPTPKPAAVPALAGASAVTAAKTAADAGIVPVTVPKFSDAPKGTVIKTIPPAGTTLAPGKKLTLVVSAGEPHVIFSNNRSIEQIDSATLKPLAPVASGPPAATDPTYSADGSSAAYVAHGQVVLKDLTAQHAAPEPLTAAGPVYTDLAWAPTADVNVLAMAQERGDVIPALGYRDTDLCLARVTTHGLTPHCKTEPGFLIERQIRWTSDGTTLLAGAVKTDGSGAFGVVRWRLEPGRRPFSTDPADWTSGDFVTDITQPHRGALDAAVSPDGKTLAVVSDFNGGIFRLWLSPTPDDFLLANAKPTSVRACQVTWRPDSRELLVIQQAASCGDRGNLGSLVRVPLDDLGAGRTLAASADDPSYQPVNIGS